MRSAEPALADLIEPVADATGYELVRVRLTGSGTRTLQIMAERPDGSMTAEDCAILSRAIGPVLDEADPIPGQYVLEVSSPGVDRPLTRLKDFERWAGFEAKLELDRMAEGRKRFRGVLAGVEEGAVGIDLPEEEETVFLPFDWIREAKLVLTDELMEAARLSAGFLGGDAEIEFEDHVDDDAPEPGDDEEGEAR